MQRRKLVTSIAAACALLGVPAHAQQTNMPVIGMLHSQTQASEASRLVPIQQGLAEAGFTVGRNVAIEHRYADGQNARLPALAAELVQARVNVIFANTTPPASAAKAATTTIPVVFVTGVDP